MRLLWLALIVLFHCRVHAQNDTLNVLFIGNSYTYTQNLPQIVSLLSQSTSTYLHTRQSTAAGAKLSQHWHGIKGLKSKEIIEKEDFDIVILQDHSRASIEFPDSIQKYSRLFAHLAISKGTKPIFYETWSREDSPDEQAKISLMYQKISDALGAEVIPVGSAWKLASENTNIKLYTADGSHPDRLGVFLSAMVITTFLTGEVLSLPKNEFSTVDLNNEFIQLMYIDDQEYEVIKSVVANLFQKR